MRVFRYLALALPVVVSAASVPLRFEELPTALKVFTPKIKTAGEFEALRTKLAVETEKRVQQGEREALVYYVLQGKRFTGQRRVEPALAAREYVEHHSTPTQAAQRIADFAASCAMPQTYERLAYFCKYSHGQVSRDDYNLAMQFLYDKEFASRASEGDERRDYVAALYQIRGLSTDSPFDANFPIYLALKSLTEKQPIRLGRVLIIGPGVDFAPRTGLNDALPPMGLQPYAVADALLQLSLSTADKMRIDCVDVNPRVVEYFQTALARQLTVTANSGSDEYQHYFSLFGRAVGTVKSTDNLITIDVTRKIADRITAHRLNILTEHDDGPAYDLVIATNVLLYFNTQELALAFANVSPMLRHGGFFVHNDTRGEIDPIGRALHLPVVNARMVRLREDDQRAIFDSYVIHQKRSGL